MNTRGFFGRPYFGVNALTTGVRPINEANGIGRPYRPAMPVEKVLTILKKESGQKLSPEGVEALGNLVSKGEL